MAARWRPRSRKRSISTMELFTGVSPLQCHPLEEDGGISDLGLPPLDACDLLGTFRGYIDPTIISIIEGAGNQNETKGRYDEENELSLLTALTEILDNADDENLSPFDSIPDSELLVSQRDRELNRFHSLSRSPPDRNHLPVDDFKGFKTHGNNATFRKVETRTEDGWGMFPDCLSSKPVRRSKGKSVRKSIQRVRELSTLQLSDGEEKVCSPDHDTSSESGVDFVDFGMDFEELSTGRTLKAETLASKHRTPHIINTASISLTDLVKYMHSYCLPSQTVIDSGNSEMEEDSLSKGEVLEIDDYLLVPTCSVNSSSVDSNVNCTAFLAEKALTKDEQANVNAVQSKEGTLSELGSKESMPPKSAIFNIHSVHFENLDPPPLEKAETDLGFNKSIEMPGVVNAKDGAVQCMESESFVNVEREVAPKLAPEMDDGMPLLQPEPKIGDTDCEPGVDKQIPALHPQPATVMYGLGLHVEASKTQVKCKDVDTGPILKREFLINDDELTKQMQQTEPEIDLQNPMQTKNKTLEVRTGRQDLQMVDSSPKAYSLTQTSDSQVSHMVQVADKIEPKLNSDMPEYFEKPLEYVDSTLVSKRKCHGRKNVAKISCDQTKKEVQNVKNRQVCVFPKSPYAPQLSEFADCEKMQLKVNLQGTSGLHSSVKESDLLIKQLEKAKRESEIEMKLLKASRAVKSRARNNADSAYAVSISEKKNSPVQESEGGQCKLENKACLLVPTEDLLENVESSLTSSMEFTGAEHVPSMEVNEKSKMPAIDVNSSREHGKCESDVAPSASLQGDPIEAKGERSTLTPEESDPGYAKDVKPKLLSLTEYRMRMQQRKNTAEGDKKENENLMSNKWPSIPEPPTELAEIPMKPKVQKDSENSAKNHVCQQSLMRDSPESPDQEFHENDVTTEIPLPYIPDSATPSVCPEKTSIETTPVLADHECTKPVYAEAPNSPWPPISSMSSRYPFLPPIPPPSLSSNAFPPLPIPPSPLLSWPPPFPPPPVSAAPFPPFPPRWAPCIPPPPLPPPPYWPSIPLPPTVPPPPIVPPPMYCDVGPPLHCPPGFPYPPNMLSAPVPVAEYLLTNAANLSQNNHSTEQKAPSTSYQKSPEVFKSIHHSVPNQDAQNTNVHGPKITEFGIPAVPQVVPNYVKTASSAPVQAYQSQTQVGTNKMGKQVCSPLKPTQQASELKVQTISAPKLENSSKVTLQTLLNNPAGTGRTKPMDPRSTNELVLKIFELLRKAQNTPVKATVPSIPLVPHSGQTVLPSISQLSSAGQEPVLSMTLKPFDTAAPSIHQKQEPIVEPHTSNDEATSLLLQTPTTKRTVLSVAEKLQKPLSVTGKCLHPVMPLENLQAAVPSVVLKVLKLQEAGPTTVLKSQATIPSVAQKLQTVQSTVLKSQITKHESQTTIQSKVASVKLEPQLLLPSAASKPQDVIASIMVQKAPLVPQALIPLASEKSQIEVGNLLSVQEKKIKKSKVNIRKRGIICKEKAIEACDVTSLLEQFEKSEEKEEKHCPQSSGDSLAVTNSRLEAEAESKPSYMLLVKGLGSTAELTPPATPPHQPHMSAVHLGTSSILNTALREGANNSPVKRAKLIDAQPLPQTKHRRQNSLSQNDIPQIPAVHVGSGDHDYCFLQSSQSETVPDATQMKTEQGLSQPGALAVEGSRWNVKHHQSIVIKPIVSLSKRSENKDCKIPLLVPGSAQSSGKNISCCPVESISQNHIETKECMDQLDHRTSLPIEANIDCLSTSVLMSPEASPCNSDGGESRTQDERVNTTVSKRSLRCYRKNKDSTSLQSADWKSRRTRASHSSCSSSESEDSSSSYSSSSSSSRSRSRSTPPKKRRRYRSINSRHSRSSSRSNYGSCGRSRGRSSSVSTCYSSRSYSTSYSRSRSRSRSRSQSPYSRRYDYYGNRANYRRRRVPQQECAIEERRVVYIGKIPGVMTRAELKHRFSVFGIIEECNIHFRDHGDNYGFVTYRYTDDAFTAIEHGHKLRRPDELPFDLCFGGRRQFCKSNYADLDSNRGDYDPVKNKFDSLDFDTLLKQAQKSIRR